MNEDQWDSEATNELTAFALSLAKKIEGIIDDTIVKAVESFLARAQSIVPSGKSAARLVAVSLVYEQINARVFAQTRILYEALRDVGASETHLSHIRDLRRYLRSDEMRELRQAVEERLKEMEG